MDKHFDFKYVSPAQLEKVVQKVQQTRKDSENDLQWQSLLRNLHSTQRSNLAQKEASVSSRSSSFSEDSSDDLSSDSSDSNSSSDKDVLPALSNSVQIPKSSTFVKSQKPRVTPKPKFDHQSTISSIKKSQEALNAALLLILQQLVIRDVPKEEPGSPRAEEKRKIRLAEFHARMRRNYIYSLKIEVDKLNSLFQSKTTDFAKNTNKQSALRILSRALNVSIQALQTLRYQIAARRDCLANLPIVSSILELLEKLEDACLKLDVKNEELISLRLKITQELYSAYIEAEKLERAYSQISVQSRAPKNQKMIKRKPPQKLKVKKRIVPHIQPASSKFSPAVADSNSKDACTETDKYVPLTELVSKIKTMQIKPTNVRFVMMQHEEVEGVCDKGAQTLLAPDENNEKETQTDDQAMILDEAQSCRVEQLIMQALEQEVPGNSDYLAQIIEQVISQEFI